MADLSVSAAGVAPGTNARTAVGTAGATITAGQVVYPDASDSNKLKLADSDALATAAAVGIALHGASAGQPLTYQFAGTIDLGVACAIGTIYVVSSTAGGIAPSADISTDDYVTILGVGDGTDLRMSLYVSNQKTPSV